MLVTLSLTLVVTLMMAFLMVRTVQTVAVASEAARRSSSPGRDGAAGQHPEAQVELQVELQLPEGQQAWQLPRAGEGNRCERGEAASVRWSPDGRYLISEVDSGQSITLCLYDLSGFSFSPGRPRRVAVHRVSSSGSLEQPAKSAESGRPGPKGADPARGESVYSRLLQRRSGYVFTELEPAWAGHIGTGAPLVFTRGAGNSWTRVYGLSDLNFDGDSRAGPLDGQRDAGSGPWAFYQPVFAPPAEAGRGTAGAQGLTAVSNYQLDCGRSRIVYLPRPGERDAVVQALTAPCGAGSRMENAADRYPAWDPRPGQDRLAFVRVNPDGINQLCVLEGARSRGASRLDCSLGGSEKSSIDRFSPVWSPDGRFLLYYSLVDRPVTDRREAGRGKNGARIEVIDFSSRDRKPGIVMQNVHPNPTQGPTLIQEAGSNRTWALGVREGEEATGRIVAISLEGGPRGAVPREIRTGLQNIRAMDVGRGRGGLELAVAAQGYQNVRGADLRGHKVFILPLSLEGW